MKTNLKITKKVTHPLKAEGDSIKAPKVQKDKSTKRRLSIYDDFSDENPDNFDINFEVDDLDQK